MVMCRFGVGGVRAVAMTERLTTLTIFGLPKHDAFHRLFRNITLREDMPLLQVASSSSVSGQIAVALSHEVFHVEHESCNQIACLTRATRA